MARSSGLLAAVIDLFRPSTTRRATPEAPRKRATEKRATWKRATGRRPADAETPAAPISTGTVEVDPRSLGRVVLEWTPSADGVPDPGEIVWTWIPYEENDGRGKDRPVLVVASGRYGLLGIQLTSKDHDGDPDHVSIGTGAWDGAHRESWARLDRVFRVEPSAVRREGSFLPESTYRGLARVLASRYGWATV
jgi:hypothetical protein